MFAKKAMKAVSCHVILSSLSIFYQFQVCVEKSENGVNWKKVSPITKKLKKGKLRSRDFEINIFT